MNLIGQKYGRLTVVDQAPDKIYFEPKTGKRHNLKFCICNCDCGAKNIIVNQNNLRRGMVTSCGCYRRERVGRLNKKENKYDLSGEYGVGWTSNTNAEFYFDLDDYDLIKNYCWCDDFIDNRYHSLTARNPENGKNISMHYLFGYKGWDHIDRNPLNNRRSNFRPATAQENARNRSLYKNNKSGYMGVCWDEWSKKWKAEIYVGGVRINLGRFSNKNEAIKIRLLAEKEHFGEFAPQKHLYEQYGIVEN